MPIEDVGLARTPDLRITRNPLTGYWCSTGPSLVPDVSELIVSGAGHQLHVIQSAVVVAARACPAN
jgi:hypothetical protein